MAAAHRIPILKVPTITPHWGVKINILAQKQWIIVFLHNRLQTRERLREGLGKISLVKARFLSGIAQIS